jgi:two-component system, NarL family, sensor histidine kinase DesK
MNRDRASTGLLAPRSKWWPMIFSALIIVLPLRHGAVSSAQFLSEALMWKLEWLGVVAFLALFAAAVESLRRHRSILWVVVAVTLLGLGFAPFNPGSTVLFAYACAFVPWAVAGDTRRTVSTVSCIIAALGIEVWLASLQTLFWLYTAGWSVIAAVSYLWVVKMMLSMERLAKMAERERIARDLHDVLGHTLSLITLKAELAGQLLAEAPDIVRARKEIADVESITRSALAEVRQTIRGYKAETLQMEFDRVASMLCAAGIAVTCEHRPIELDSTRETVLGLALREAVTNVVRHAQAQNCLIRVQQADGACLLQVEDDGIGGLHPEGQGLRGMRERIEALGGSLQLDRSGGTRLTVRVPLSPTR